MEIIIILINKHYKNNKLIKIYNMSVGTYGTVRPADVIPQDMEIFVHYTPNRGSSQGTSLFKLDPSTVISQPTNPNGNGVEIFGGLYTLTLPSTQFSNKGFYTIVIKPAEIRTSIVDCGILTTLSDTKGLIFSTTGVSPNFRNKFENGSLVGYRIEYLDENNNKIPNFFTIITSNNRAEAVNQNISNSNQKSIRYRFNPNSELTFCTVSPNSSPSVKPNAVPFIGNPNQNVIITNTFFNPIMLELEIVEHDVETLAYGIFGNQTKSVEDGIYTIYNFNNDIYKQWDLYEIKDEISGKPLFEVREERTGIDFTKQFNNIINI